MEETISLSNVNNQEKAKIITIRPLHEFKEEKASDQDNTLIEKTSIQLELEKAKQELHSAEQQREKIINNLHNEIEREKLAWEQIKQEEMERIQQEAYQTGFEEGKNESLAQYKHLIDKANELVNRATAQYYEKIEEHESTIIHLSIQIAEKILNNTLSEDPSSFIPVVKAAIQDLKDNFTYKIYVHPNKYNIVTEQKDELHELVDEKATISLYIDDEIGENSCLIEHSAGRIDASVDSQLKEIKRALTELMETNE